MVDNYKNLEVWQLAMEQCVNIYNLTKQFPKEETYGLVAQLRRSTVSVASNITEGFVRKHSREFKQFLNIAIGSNSEIETQLILSYRLNYISNPELDKQITINNILGKKLTTLYNNIL